MLRAALVSLGLLIGACSGPTTLLLVVDDSAATMPGPIHLSLFDPFHALFIDREVGSGSGTMVLKGFDPAPTKLRVVALSDGLGAAMAFELKPGQQTRVPLVLGPYIDFDGDDVPDTVDNCQSVNNADQRDSNGDGLGDACATMVDMSVNEPDLSENVDFAGVDLTGVDFAKPPPDMVHVDLANALVCPVGAKLCEDFETGTINTTRWPENYNSPSGALTLSTLKPHKGLYSMRAHSDASTSNHHWEAQLVNYNAFPANPTFVRAWIYFDAVPASGGTSLLNVQQADAPTAGMTFFAYPPTVGVSGYNGLEALSTSSSGGDQITSPTKRWICFEWQVTNVGGGQVRTFIDGTEYPTAAGTYATVNPAMGKIVLGAETDLMNGAPAFDIYFDDIVLSTSRIGCN